MGSREAIFVDESTILIFLFFDTLFAVHYEKIRNHLRKTASNSRKIHSLQIHSIAFLDNLRVDKTNINALVQSIERSLHLIHKNRFSIKQYQFQKPWPEFQSIISLNNFSI